MVAPDSLLEGVRRQRPWDATPSEQAVQSVTGAFESTDPPGVRALDHGLFARARPACSLVFHRSDRSDCALAAINPGPAQALRLTVSRALVQRDVGRLPVRGGEAFVGRRCRIPVASRA